MEPEPAVWKNDYRRVNPALIYALHLYVSPIFQVLRDGHYDAKIKVIHIIYSDITIHIDDHVGNRSLISQYLVGLAPIKPIIRE